MQNQKIKDSIKSTFDGVAEEYDNNKQFIISAKKMVELIELENDELKILDLSTGTGNIAIELAKKFPKATIYGVDISSKMLKYAEEKTAKGNITNITYYLQDVEKLDFDGMQFDVITCGYGLFFYPQMEQVFCDVCSKLKTGGKFVFSTWTTNAFQPYSKIFLEMLESNHNIKSPLREDKKRLITTEEIEEFSSLVAYQNLQIHPIDIRFAMSIDEWWKLLNSTGYQGRLNQLGQNYRKFEQEYLEHLHSLHNDGNIEFNADSFVSIVSV